MKDKEKIVRVILEILRYVISAILGLLGGGFAASCIG